MYILIMLALNVAAFGYLGWRADAWTCRITFGATAFLLGTGYGLTTEVFTYLGMVAMAFMAGRWLARQRTLARSRDQRRLSEARRMIIEE